MVAEYLCIQPEEPPVSYKLSNEWVTQVDSYIYIDDVLVEQTEEELIGAVKSQGFIVLAFEAYLLLFTEDMELVEKISPAQGLPSNISAIAIFNTNSIVVKHANGIAMADNDIIHWKEVDDDNYSWHTPSPLPQVIQAAIMRKFRGDGLSLERVLIDIHSGRIMGTIGVVIMDIAVILFLILSGTGWWVWFKRRALQKTIDDE